MNSSGRQLLGLAGWLAISFAAAGVGGIASSNAGPFYEQLSRPSWAPAASLFGPVWSVLYLMQGVAVWLIWRERGVRNVRRPLSLFVVQLAANALWTWLFFGFRTGLLAFVEIILLWALIVATIAAFRGVRPVAWLLLVPYLLWVSFATALTYSIWQRNPQILG